MEVLYLLIPIALVLVAVVVVVLCWAVQSGQFDDLTGPAHRILMDDDAADAPPDGETEREATETRASREPRAQNGNR